MKNKLNKTTLKTQQNIRRIINMESVEIKMYINNEIGKILYFQKWNKAIMKIKQKQKISIKITITKINENKKRGALWISVYCCFL